MTTVASSTESYDSSALKESLDSVIWDLFPEDTWAVTTTAPTFSIPTAVAAS